MLYAPFIQRIYAFVLDYLIIAAYGVFVVGTMAFVFQPYVTPFFTQSPLIAQGAGFLMMTLPVSLYFIFMEQSKWQGTWGKKKVGIKVADESGRRISLVRSIIRTAIKFFPWEVSHFVVWHMRMPGNVPEGLLSMLLIVVNLMIVAFFTFPLLNRKKKNMYDWFAGTVVVLVK